MSCSGPRRELGEAATASTSLVVCASTNLAEKAVVERSKGPTAVGGGPSDGAALSPMGAGEALLCAGAAFGALDLLSLHHVARLACASRYLRRTVHNWAGGASTVYIRSGKTRVTTGALRFLAAHSRRLRHVLNEKAFDFPFCTADVQADYAAEWGRAVERNRATLVSISNPPRIVRLLLECPNYREPLLGIHDDADEIARLLALQWSNWHKQDAPDTSAPGLVGTPNGSPPPPSDADVSAPDGSGGGLRPPCGRGDTARAGERWRYVPDRTKCTVARCYSDVDLRYIAAVGKAVRSFILSAPAAPSYLRALYLDCGYVSPPILLPHDRLEFVHVAKTVMYTVALGAALSALPRLSTLVVETTFHYDELHLCLYPALLHLKIKGAYLPTQFKAPKLRTYSGATRHVAWEAAQLRELEEVELVGGDVMGDIGISAWVEALRKSAQPLRLRRFTLRHAVVPPCIAGFAAAASSSLTHLTLRFGDPAIAEQRALFACLATHLPNLEWLRVRHSLRVVDEDAAADNERSLSGRAIGWLKRPGQVTWASAAAATAGEDAKSAESAAFVFARLRVLRVCGLTDEVLAAMNTPLLEELRCDCSVGPATLVTRPASFVAGRPRLARLSLCPPDGSGVRWEPVAVPHGPLALRIRLSLSGHHHARRAWECFSSFTRELELRSATSAVLVVPRTRALLDQLRSVFAVSECGKGALQCITVSGVPPYVLDRDDTAERTWRQWRCDLKVAGVSLRMPHPPFLVNHR